ncbi:MAG: serine/threonine-protein phosphatase [Clostridia bacterium]|nr:serine/threonine-protein phosphatase [Clostridia bacterium]
MRKRKFGLKYRVGLYCVLFTVLLASALSFASYRQFRRTITDRYYAYAATVLDLARSYLDRNGIADEIRAGEMGEGYQKTREDLNMLKENSDIAYVYAVYFERLSDPGSMRYVINGARKADLEGKAEEEVYSYLGEECAEGDFDAEMRSVFIRALAEGNRDIQYIENSTEEYGDMLTCYRVLFGADDKPVCIVSTDLDINAIRSSMEQYLRRTAFISLGMMVLLVALFIIYIQMRVTGPITRISGSTDEFVQQLHENVDPSELEFRHVEVRTRDETQMLASDIGALADSLKGYMSNLQTVTAEKQRISSELSVATRIQADMLPRIFPNFANKKEYELYASMSPAKEVGGDFFDFFMVDDDHLCMVMADVSGKGVPAALFMVISKTLIKNRAQRGDSPAEILRNVNAQLCDGNEAQLFVTVWVAILELSTGKGVAANAGHEHPVLRRGGGSFELVVYRHAPALAMIEEVRFKEHEFVMNPGDTLFVYTDGVPEATNAENELFGNERMLRSLNREPDASAEMLLRNVRRDVDAFVGSAPQFDDITMLALRYKGPGN